MRLLRQKKLSLTWAHQTKAEPLWPAYTESGDRGQGEILCLPENRLWMWFFHVYPLGVHATSCTPASIIFHLSPIMDGGITTLQSFIFRENPNQGVLLINSQSPNQRLLRFLGFFFFSSSFRNQIGRVATYIKLSIKDNRVKSLKAEAVGTRCSCLLKPCLPLCLAK